jgi:hypothetical protein
MSISARKAQPRQLTVDSGTRVPIRQTASTSTTPLHIVGAGDGRTLTADDVATLVNEGHLTLRASDALLAEAGLPPLKANRRATYLVPIAVPAAADSRPAAAIRQLADTVDSALRHMDWTDAAADPEGYAIDPPSSAPASGGLGHSLVHADLRLKVTVPAYRKYQFRRVAEDLLQRDLRHLYDLGARAGQPRRCPAGDEDPEVLSREYGGELDSHGIRIAPDDMDDDRDSGWFD